MAYGVQFTTSVFVLHGTGNRDDEIFFSSWLAQDFEVASAAFMMFPILLDRYVQKIICDWTTLSIYLFYVMYDD